MVTSAPVTLAESNVKGNFISDRMQFRFDQENSPNARVLLPSIRHSGYTLETAIGDLVDNTIDAGAALVVVELARTGDGEWLVSVSDDGAGMDRDTLDQMLRLGSETEHDLEKDLGAFGLGSTTASLSLGRRQHVITASGAFLSGATDLDVTVETGDFLKHLDVATDEEVATFRESFERWGLEVPAAGTVVRVTKCDNIGRVTLKPALDAVKRYIGSTYRYFINAGKAFYVNGELVEADDPLWRDHPETTVLLEDTFEYTYPRSDARFGRKETVGCVLVYLPDMGGIEENKRHGLTADRAGFYVMRNRRQIVPASMFGTFTRHPEFNRFRGELLFPATMDRDLGVSFLKSSWDIRPSQSLKDKIESEVGPYMRQARKLYRKMRVVADDQISHDEAAKTITQRSPFLRKPRSETERRATESKGEGSVQPKESSRERYPLARAQAALADRVRFETRSDGPTAPFYEATLDGRRVVIAYNVDHAFYERFLVENRDNRSLVVGIDYLVYSLATAEILARDDDTYEFLRRMREDMSFNLRQLLTT